MSEVGGRSININVPVLARVEGEGALDIRIEQGRIVSAHLRIYEPPRFFEKFLEGREYHEVPDMVARICGICPVAYQMSAVHALENIFGTTVTPWVRAMRRVMYCGEWIESHSLHIHLLAAPDFLGYGSAIEMARDHAAAVRRGLRLQELGNALLRLLGARSVHPVGVRVGGFHRSPTMAEVADLLVKLRAAVPEAEALIAWTASLPLPESATPFTAVALRHPDEYPLNQGRIVSGNGLDIAIADYERHFAESHVAHSTALYSLFDGQPYLVGPLARINLNLERLHPAVRRAIAASGIRFPSANMFHSIAARAAEIYQALLEAIALLEAYAVPDSPYVAVETKAGVGYGCTEAPRGILWHRYQVDDAGNIVTARIVPPTSQNQAQIEADLLQSLAALGADRDEESLRLRAEQVIRNYDPCISCATHFLKLTVTRA